MIRLPLGKGIAGTVAKTGETIRIDDAYADPRFDPSTDKRSGFRTRSILCAPIKNRTGRRRRRLPAAEPPRRAVRRSPTSSTSTPSPSTPPSPSRTRVLHASALEKERQDREIKVAQGIQRALLPAELELERRAMLASPG